MIPCPSPAHRAVVTILRAAQGLLPSDAERADLATAQPEAIAAICGAHVVLPAMQAGIRAMGEECPLPSDLALFFREMEQANRRRNAELRRQLEELSRLFAGHGLAAVLLKGGCELVTPSYSAPARRFISDLDLLVTEADIDRANEILIQAGCVPAEMAEINARTHHHLPALMHAEWTAPVELHRELAQHGDTAILPADELIKKATPSGLSGILIPCWQDRLTHLAIHAQINDRGHADRKLFLRHILDLTELAPHLPKGAFQATLEAFGRADREAALRMFIATAEILFPGRMDRALADDLAERNAGAAIRRFGRPREARLREALGWAGWYLKGFFTDPARRRHYLAQLSRPDGIAKLLRFHRDRNRGIR